MVPIMIGVFSLVFPSGLNVYILTNQVLSMAHQLYMNHADKQSSAPVPAPQVTPPPVSVDEPLAAAAGAGGVRTVAPRKKKKKRR